MLGQRIIGKLWALTAAFMLMMGAAAMATPFSLKSSINTIWRAQDGLPQEKINAMLQSRDGYIWLATQDGLARFDGDKFTVFDTQNTPGLATNGVEQLLEDADGALWAAGTGGISRLQNGVAVNRTPSSDIDCEVRVTCQLDAHGTLWAERSGSFYRSEGGMLKRTFSVAGYSGQTVVKHWTVGPDGVLWIEQDDGSLLEIRSGKIIHIAIPLAAQCVRVIKSLQCDASGIVWVGTDCGAYTIHNSALVAIAGLPKAYARCTIRVDSEGGVWSLVDNTLYQYAGGRFVVNRDWAGVKVGAIDLNASGALICRFGETQNAEHPFDAIALKINKTFVSISQPDGLAGLPICAMRDWQGGVWVGTENGLDRLREGPCHTFTADDGLPRTPIQCLFADAANHLWASAGEAGLYQDSGAILGRFHRVGDQNTQITSLCETPYGSILGLWQGRVRQLIGAKTVDVGARYGNDLIESADAIAISAAGDVWIMGDHEFVRTRRGHSVVVPVSTAGNPIFAAAVDRQGRLWASGANNLYCVEGTRVQTFSSTEGVPNIPIVAMCADSDGAMWFGHKGGGVTRCKNGVFRTLTMRDGLCSDGIYQILEDDRRSLWMGSSKGVFRVSLDDLNQRIEGGKALLRYYAFGAEDGATGGQAYTGRSSSACRLRYADLWFSGMHGVVHVDSGNMQSKPSTALIEQIEIDERRYDHSTHINVSPGDGNAQFHFTTLDYRNPSHQHFQYRLQGFDKGWQDDEGVRTATYTNLPPGSYRFHVRCANADSPWSGDTVVSFQLRPHPYQTWWFKTLLGFASAGVLLTLVFVPILRRRNCLLRRMQGRLEMQNEELTASRSEIINSQQLLEAQNEELIAGQQELLGIQQELQAANARLHALATTDGLTGIINHRTFQETLHGEWRRDARESTPLSLLLIDVDQFKSYNDVYGHPAGDAVLIQVARILSETARDTDLVARYGGEEFVAILRNTDAHGARILGERLRAAIADADWPKRAITISIGAATVCDKIPFPEPLIEAADTALYCSKNLGRNRFTHVFDADDSAQDRAA